MGPSGPSGHLRPSVKPRLCPWVLVLSTLYSWAVSNKSPSYRCLFMPVRCFQDCHHDQSRAKLGVKFSQYQYCLVLLGFVTVMLHFSILDVYKWDFVK